MVALIKLVNIYVSNGQHYAISTSCRYVQNNEDECELETHYLES